MKIFYNTRRSEFTLPKKEQKALSEQILWCRWTRLQFRKQVGVPGEPAKHTVSSGLSFCFLRLHVASFTAMSNIPRKRKHHAEILRRNTAVKYKLRTPRKLFPSSEFFVLFPTTNSKFRSNVVMSCLGAGLGNWSSNHERCSVVWLTEGRQRFDGWKSNARVRRIIKTAVNSFFSFQFSFAMDVLSRRQMQGTGS